MCIKSEVSITHISRSIEKMWQKENKYGCQICTICHMTFNFELGLAIMKVNMHARSEDIICFKAFRIYCVNRQTDNQYCLAIAVAVYFQLSCQWPRPKKCQPMCRHLKFYDLGQCRKSVYIEFSR